LTGLSTFFQSSAEIYCPLSSDVSRCPAPVIKPLPTYNPPISNASTSNARISNAQTSNAPSLPNRAAPPAIPSRQLQAKALYAFQPQSQTELALKPGDIILITNNSNADWWVGTCNGKTGDFPANYVQLLK